MEWQLTMDGVQIVSAIVALICFIPIGLWLMKIYAKYLIGKKSHNTGIDKYWVSAIAILMANVMIFAMITSFAARIILAIGEVLTFFLFILSSKRQTSSLSKLETSTENITTNEVHKSLKIFKNTRAMLALTGGAVMYLGVFPLLLWTMPDVAYVSKEGNTFYAKLRYEIPYTKNFKPGDSYIVNETPDTLLRVIVRYAFPDRDRSNVYGVKAKYPPHSTTKMTDKADYIMRQIPLYLSPQVSRGRSYPRKNVFIVDKEQLWDFQRAGMQKFGLRNNREVDKDSISEPVNKTVIDAKLKEMPVSAKSSFYNYRYDGC